MKEKEHHSKLYMPKESAKVPEDCSKKHKSNEYEL